MLAQALRRARLALFWERLWPALAALATAIGLFLCVSWLGLWLVLPPIGRAIGLFLFLLITAAALVPTLRLRLPTHHDGLRRLDHESGLLHRPATAVADNMATTADDAVSVALWQAHVERAIRAARDLRAGFPAPRLAARDPVALRALVLVLLVATFVAADGERDKRIAAAFDWRGALPVANFRVDAWVTPPQYTGKPPIILHGLRPGESAQAGGSLAVPTGSTLVVRASGKGDLDVAARGGVAEASAEAKAAAPAGTEERRFTITDTGSATVRGVGPAVTWWFTAIPDKPPTIALAKDPEPQQRGSLLLAYKIEDDYGVTEAKAEFAQKAAPARDGQDARPLFGPPEMALVLPQSRTRNGVGQTTKDLTEHPWAGGDVSVSLLARDEAGNEGRSASHDFRLPQRVFVKPMARALVEQRRNLALDANARPRIALALEALTVAPDRFKIEAGVYLGLRSIAWHLDRARSDDDLREVVAQLWAMALTIEDGTLSDVERELRAAQEALRQALERGASEEEIKKLMEQLRAAMDKFMRQLAEQMRRNPQRDELARPLDRNTRMLSRRDLDNMLNRLEQLARQGNREAAQKLLDELANMMNNLQMARPGQQGDGDDEMAMLDELADMIRKQQQLRDRTFQQGQDQRRERQQRGQRGQRGQQGQQGQQGENQMGGLRQDQQALRDRLKQLLDQLAKRGLGQPQPGQEGEGADQLGRAGEAMGDAEGQLGQGDADSAVDSQGRALEAMRKGAQGLAQSMQQQMGEGPGQGPGQPTGRRQSRAEQNTDPLGRPMRGRDYDDHTVKVPEAIDAQRARRVLEELRRRFGESFRPQLELDYIERLLRDF
jgi:uncharacterized protein (TIGR02302 family)